MHLCFVEEVHNWAPDWTKMRDSQEKMVHKAALEIPETMSSTHRQQLEQNRYNQVSDGRQAFI